MKKISVLWQLICYVVDLNTKKKYSLVYPKAKFNHLKKLITLKLLYHYFSINIINYLLLPV